MDSVKFGKIWDLINAKQNQISAIKLLLHSLQEQKAESWIKIPVDLKEIADVFTTMQKQDQTTLLQIVDIMSQGREEKETMDNNKNRFLGELEVWLRKLPGVKFDHPNKTMNTYTSISKEHFDERGLVWVYTNGRNYLHLRQGDYSSVDIDIRILDEERTDNLLLGHYPQFIINEKSDIDYAKKLIEYALNWL